MRVLLKKEALTTYPLLMSYINGWQQHTKKSLHQLLVYVQFQQYVSNNSLFWYIHLISLYSECNEFEQSVHQRKPIRYTSALQIPSILYSDRTILETLGVTFPAHPAFRLIYPTDLISDWGLLCIVQKENGIVAPFRLGNDVICCFIFVV